MPVKGDRLKTSNARRSLDNLRKKPASPPRPRRAARKAVDGGVFPVVGIGASAGGLDAFLRFFKELPVATGMAYVVIQHMDPLKESFLADILSRSVRIPIVEAKDRMRVMPDRIHVIPPNTNMGIAHGRLSLVSRPERRGLHLPVDFFFRSLAQDRREKAIGVVLSGNGSDGSQGVRAIKAEGGITFAEDEKSAKYSGMPSSAVATGCIDFVLPPGEIAAELARISSHPYVARESEVPARGQALEAEEDIGRIFLLVKNATGVDFAQYKTSTTMRRIQRRMALHKIDDLTSYSGYIQDHPGELDALSQDFLINVTSFFRDPGVFEALSTKVFPILLEGQVSSDARVWVPACSTGEEAYSIALSFLEAMESRRLTVPFQIFATDIHEASLEVARAGIYPEGIVQDVSPERLRRFFIRTAGGYQISKAVRESCIFARQNLAKDPPFSRLDVISCRNAMIYMKPPLQKKILSSFHYGLKPGRFLLLGTSETVGEMGDLFEIMDRKSKIYCKKEVLARPPAEFDTLWYRHDASQARRRAAGIAPSLESIEEEADGIVLSRYGPPGVVVNEQLDIVQFRGDTTPFLAPAPGTATLNFAKMAREGLLPDVRMAIRKARTKSGPVGKDGVVVAVNGDRKEIGLQVIPINLPTLKDLHYLILFEEARRRTVWEPGRKNRRGSESAPKEREEYVAQLENELSATKEYLQTMIEEQEATNEEIAVRERGDPSSNEELQSTNEELETAKEELQSTNEELNTVNESLANRNMELSQLNNDLLNLLVSINIPIVMLGHDLRIRRFTPTAEKVLSLIPTDVGRSIGDLRPSIPLRDLDRKTREVLENLSVLEEEIVGPNGRCHLVRIKPYRTEDHKIEGAVIVLFDVTDLRSSQQLEDNARISQGIVETAREPLLVLDGTFKVRFGNHSFYRVFRTTPEETESRSFFDLGDGRWRNPRLRSLLEKILPRKSMVRDFRVTQDFPGVGRKTILLNARRIRGKVREQDMILLAIEEVDLLAEVRGKP